MILGVVGEPWGPTRQTASHALHTVEAVAMSRESEPLCAAAGAGAREDISPADDCWEADDYLTGEDSGAVPAAPAGGRGAEGCSPNLFDGAPTPDADLPLIETPQSSEVLDARTDRQALPTTPPVPLEDPFEADGEVAPEEIELPIEGDADVDLAGDWEQVEHERALDRMDRDGVQGWDVDVELPDFDPDARVEPWHVPDEADDVALRKARLKAATLAAELDLVAPAEIRQVTAYLVELYAEAPHPATHVALRQLAHEGLDFETLQAMVNLRREWSRRSDWWLYRYRGVPFQHDGCRSAMTWRLAHDVCRRRSEYPPECMIDEEWVEEWYRLPSRAAGYYSFASFVAEKVDSSEAEALFDGLILGPGDHRERPDAGDHHADLYRVQGYRRDE